jgi:thiosulfate/3-mercaptopyruvate sulfurtransferase
MLNTLLSADTLNSLLNENPIILDCRFNLLDSKDGFLQYTSDHITGAHYLHLNNDMSGEIAPENGRHPLPIPSDFIAVIESMGATKDATIIAYDDNNHCYAARAWWILQSLGYKNTWVLNGGYSNWKKLGFPTNKEIPARITVNSLSNSTSKWALPTITLTDIKENKSKNSYLLIDARETPRFLGEVEPIDPHAGHIPGAINKPWLEVIDSDGHFKSQEYLEKHWLLDNELDNDKNITAHYCGSGVTACVNILTSIIAGHEPPALYAGGWSQWCNTP